jgi:hypothetical protein
VRLLRYCGRAGDVVGGATIDPDRTLGGRGTPPQTGPLLEVSLGRTAAGSK